MHPPPSRCTSQVSGSWLRGTGALIETWGYHVLPYFPLVLTSRTCLQYCHSRYTLPTSNVSAFYDGRITVAGGRCACMYGL